MFRPMRRAKQQMPREECAALLRQEKRGVLSLLGDDGYPYGVPMDYVYCPEEGRLYFHSSKQGHKADTIRTYDKASFCVVDSDRAEEGKWALHFNSVIVFGRIRVMEDGGKIREILRGLTRRFTADETYIEDVIARSAANAMCFALEIEHISGKRITES